MLTGLKKFGVIGPLLALSLGLGACAHTSRTSIQGVGPSVSQNTQPVKELSKAQVVQSLIRVADSLRENGEYDTAVGVYGRAREADPKDPRISLGLAESFWALGDWEDAGRAYEDAHALDPNNREARIGIGNALIATGRLDEAVKQFQTLIAVMPDEPKVYSGLGIAYDLQGNHKDAQLRYGMGLEVAPSNEALKNNLAVSFALAHDYATAVELLRTLPDAPKTRQNLALVYGLANEPQKAAQMAHMDLDDQAVQNNLAYYAWLRSLDDTDQAQAVLLGRDPTHGSTNQAAAAAPKPAPANKTTGQTAERMPAAPAVPAKVTALAGPKTKVVPVPPAPAEPATSQPPAEADAKRSAQITPEAGSAPAKPAQIASEPAVSPHAVIVTLAPISRPQVAEAETAPTPEPSEANAAPTPPSATPAVPASKPAAKLYQAQLASFPSLSDTEATKDKLIRSHGDLLNGFDLIIEQAHLGADKGSFHRLRTAPTADKSSTQALCKALKAVGTACYVVIADPSEPPRG